MTVFIVIMILLVIAAAIWKFTGHNFNFIRNIFKPPTPRTKGYISNIKVPDGTLSSSSLAGVKESIKLKSGGGTLNLSLDVNILTASKEDRDFINDILQKIQEYKDKAGREGEEK